MASEIYTVTFLRHGESVGNLENRFQGHADFPLTETGRAQARALAERWHTEGRLFERVFSSPLARARETAEILSLIHISEPTRLGMISYAVFCLKKKKK